MSSKADRALRVADRVEDSNSLSIGEPDRWGRPDPRPATPSRAGPIRDFRALGLGRYAAPRCGRGRWLRAHVMRRCAIQIAYYGPYP